VDLLVQTILIYSLVLFAASLFQTITGFGSALIASPILFAVYEPKTVVATLAVPIFLTVAIAAWKVRAEIPWKRVLKYSAWMVAGIPLGVLCLNSVSPRVMKGVMGVMLLLSLVPPTKLGVIRVWTLPWLNGILAGILTGFLGTPGAAVVAYVHGQDWPHSEKRATSLAIFTVGQGIRLFFYAGTSLLGGAAIWGIVVGVVPAIVAGILLGVNLSSKLSPKQISFLVKIGIFALAVMMLKDAF
jgi:uncharacterized membrane protein YfcA